MLLARQSQVLLEIQQLKPELLAISHDIYHKPELGNREYFARRRLAGYLNEKGWDVQKSVGGLSTSFTAVSGSPSRPAVAFLAEYDALPEIGHGCGHNLICAAGIGAAVALSRALSGVPGQVRVVGTPAEETTGGKVTLLQKGFFDDLDAVMMFHPGISNTIHFSSLALEALELTFYGESGHSALMSGAKGDTLEALLQFFNRVNRWKTVLPTTGQVQGVITEGGKVPNIRPGKTVARFYLRAPDEKDLDELAKQFRDEAQRIAAQTGTQAVIVPFETRYLPFRSNETLAGAFLQSLKKLNVTASGNLYQGTGSMDIGNVSYHVPSIHPYLTVEGGPSMLHTAEFAAAAGGDWGDRLLLLAARALALTGLQVMTQEQLRHRIMQEHISRQLA